MTKNASRKCGVITEHGVFQFNRMPFGLKNAPSAFMRIMSRVFEGCESFVLVYIDDILIFTRDKDFNKHLEHVRIALDRLREFGFKLSPKKCFFAQKKIDFLGHEVSEEGYFPCEKNLESIRNFPVPKTAKQLKSFLGMCGYFRRYIEFRKERTH